MHDEQTIRDGLAIAIKDLRVRGTRETPPVVTPKWLKLKLRESGEDAMDDNDIIFNTGYACALAEILGKDKLGQTLHTKFVSEWY